MAMNRTDPFIAFGGKIDPISDIRNAGIITNGDVYWVSAVGDSRHTTRTDAYGRTVVKTAIQDAVDVARTDQNDYIMIIPSDANAVWTLGTALDLNKNRLHVIGVGYTKSPDQYSVTLRGFGSTTVDTEMVNVIGGGIEFAGIKVLGTFGTGDNGTVSNGFVRIGTASAGTGHDFWMHDSVIESGVSGVAFGTPALVMTPGTVNAARFDNVSFLVPNDTLEKAHAGLVDLGPGGKRWKFRDCYFEVFAGSTADHFVTCGSGAKEMTVFEDCKFMQTGTVIMASAITGSVTVRNPVVSFHHIVAGSVTQFGTDPNVWKAPAQGGTRALVYDQGLAVGTAMLVAA